MNACLCPFCGNIMYFNTNSFRCNTCDFTANVKLHQGEFGKNTPKHLVESYKFLEEFAKRDPLMALSTIDLFDKKFVASDVIYIKDVTDILSKVNDIQVSDDFLADCHIIAGRRVLANNIVKTMIMAVNDTCRDNPLIYEESPTAKLQLYLTWAAHNYNININPVVYKTITAYFRPTLEGKIHALALIPDVIDEPVVTNNEAIYSFVLTEPDVVIGYASGQNSLRDCIINYIKACLNDLDDLDIAAPDGFYPEVLLSNEERFNQFMHALLCSTPSTAINNTCNDTVFASFDILEHAYFVSPFSEDNAKTISDEDVTFLEKTFDILSHCLCNAYPNITLYDREYKEKYLRKHSYYVPIDADTVVVEFWKCIANSIK